MKAIKVVANDMPEIPEQCMIKVIGTRGSGKTTKLLNLAAENGVDTRH